VKFSKHFWLRLFLGYSALGWGVCLAGVFVSHETMLELLRFFGGVDASGLGDPIYDYWFRMASSVFGLVGIVYLVLAANPAKYAVALPWAGIFMVAEGIVLFVHGILLDLPPTPWLGDVGFCLVGGVGILVAMRGLSD